jgi:pyruvate formate lyase activating enzyme
MHFTAFHPAWRMLDRPPTPPETVKRARMIALKNGVRHAYTGNIHDPLGASTYCHNCKQRLIERIGYSIGEWDLAIDGTCNACGTPCVGVFEAEPGSWGAARQPVFITADEFSGGSKGVSN